MNANRLFPQIHIGWKRFCAIRPYELYGASNATMALAPAINATIKIMKNPYLRIFFSGDQLYHFRVFFRLPLCVHATMSWNMPIGQMTEQYTRPIRRVSIRRTATTARFKANAAGRNCILAIHPNQLVNNPEKSRNRRVQRINDILARMIRIFLSIGVMIY